MFRSHGAAYRLVRQPVITEEQIQQMNLDHRDAMAQVDFALQCRVAGNEDSAIAYFRDAFTREARAASMLLEEWDHEPSRAVLCRSASCIAMDARMPTEAAAWAAHGLRGRCRHRAIRWELFDVLDRAGDEGSRVSIFKHGDIVRDPESGRRGVVITPDGLHGSRWKRVQIDWEENETGIRATTWMGVKRLELAPQEKIATDG